MIQGQTKLSQLLSSEIQYAPCCVVHRNDWGKTKTRLQ